MHSLACTLTRRKHKGSTAEKEHQELPAVECTQVFTFFEFNIGCFLSHDSSKHIPHIISSSAHTSTTHTHGLNDGRISPNKMIAAAALGLIIILLVIRGYSLYATILGIVGGCLLFFLLTSKEDDIKSKADQFSRLSSVHACRYVYCHKYMYTETKLVAFFLGTTQHPSDLYSPYTTSDPVSPITSE